MESQRTPSMYCEEALTLVNGGSTARAVTRVYQQLCSLVSVSSDITGFAGSIDHHSLTLLHVYNFMGHRGIRF